MTFYVTFILYCT